MIKILPILTKKLSFFQVTGTTDRAGRVKYLSKFLTMSGAFNYTSGSSNFLVIYEVFQVYNSDNPSVCEVFYTFQQKVRFFVVQY